MVKINFTHGHIKDILPNTRESVKWRMNEFSETYEVAKAKVRAQSIAGIGVWRVLDAEFNDCTVDGGHSPNEHGDCDNCRAVMGV